MNQQPPYYRGPANELIERARVRAGLTAEDLAERGGLPAAWYRDLEHDADEAYANLSLAHLSWLAHMLEVRPQELILPHDERVETDVTFDALSEALTRLYEARGGTLEDFSLYIGWDMADVLIDPEMFWNFNVDGLQDCSRAVGLDWRRAIPNSIP